MEWFLLIVFGLLVCGIASGFIASGKGKSGGAWFCAGFFMGLLGVALAILTQPDQKIVEQRQVASGEMKRCPECAELIRSGALRCRHCGAPQEKIERTGRQPKKYVPPGRAKP